jgi:prepilin-type processing-associated H-X9-DG protein
MKEQGGWLWAIGARTVTLFNTVLPPNTSHQWSSCYLNGSKGAFPSESQFINASSFHPGGCNFTFADGSVKFIKNTISMPTYWALGTASYGEIISADSY